MSDRQVGIRYLNKKIPKHVIGYQQCLERGKQAQDAAQRKDWSSAISLLRQNLVWCRTNLPTDQDYEITVWYQEDLASYLAEQGNDTEALVHIADAYDIRQEVAPNAQQTLETLDKYAHILARLGRHGLAATKFEIVWNAQKAALGEENPLTLTTGAELASCWFNHGMAGSNKLQNIRKARDLHKTILAAMERETPPDVLAIASTRADLACDYMELGAFQTASELAQKSLAELIYLKDNGGALGKWDNVNKAHVFCQDLVRDIENRQYWEHNALQEQQRKDDELRQQQIRRQDLEQQRAREQELREQDARLREKELREKQQREAEQLAREEHAARLLEEQRRIAQALEESIAWERAERAHKELDDERTQEALLKSQLEEKERVRQEQERWVQFKRELEIKEQAKRRLEQEAEAKRKEDERKELEAEEKRKEQERWVQFKRELEIKEQANKRLEQEAEAKRNEEEREKLEAEDKRKDQERRLTLKKEHKQKVQLKREQERQEQAIRNLQQGGPAVVTGNGRGPVRPASTGGKTTAPGSLDAPKDKRRVSMSDMRTTDPGFANLAEPSQPNQQSKKSSSAKDLRNNPKPATGALAGTVGSTPNPGHEEDGKANPKSNSNDSGENNSHENPIIITIERAPTMESLDGLKKPIGRSLSTRTLNTQSNFDTSNQGGDTARQRPRRSSDPTDEQHPAERLRMGSRPVSMGSPYTQVGSPYDATEEPIADRGVDRWFNDIQAINEYIFSPFRRAAGKRVKIGILDTGIDMNHSTFKDKNVRKRIKKRVDFVEKGGDATDICGHGTHCVGLLNRIAPSADIYVGRVAVGFEKGPDADVVAEAIRRALGPKGKGSDSENWNVDILTLSLGFKAWNKAVKAALDETTGRGHGKLVLAAASNSGLLGNMAFPASLMGVIAINSATANGTPSGFNPRSNKSEKRLTVLGEAVPSAWTTYSRNSIISPVLTSNPGATKRMTGTSVATPIAAGIVALLLEVTMIDVPDEEDTAKILEEIRPWLKGYEGMMAVLMDKSVPSTGGYHNIVPQKLMDPTWPEERRINRIGNRLRDILTEHFGDLRDGP